MKQLPAKSQMKGMKAIIDNVNRTSLINYKKHTV